MGQMTKANAPLERLAMTSLIGKIVTVDRDRFIHQDNEVSTLNYELPANAKEAKLSIMNEAGEKIGTRDLGPVKKGPHAYQWDGKKEDGMAASSGNYLFRVEAVDDTGKHINIESRIQAPVVGISFEGGEGVLLVGDVKNPTKTSMKNITRVDTMVRDMGASNPTAHMNPLSANGVPAELQAKIMESLGGVGGSAVFAGDAGSEGGSETGSDEGNSVTERGPMNSLPPPVKDSTRSTASSSLSNNSYLNSGSSNNIQKSTPEGFPNGLSSGDTSQ